MGFRISHKHKPPAPRTSKYPLAKMKVGDSFFVPWRGRNQDDNTMRASISRSGHRMGKKFSIRRVDGGCRVWRIK
jgi:hypothetical protein